MIAVVRTALLVAVAAAAVSCTASQPAPPAPPRVTLPADMPPLVCADLEPAPVPEPDEKFVGRRCTDPDGSQRWVSTFYQCTDGTVWPVISEHRGPTDEPTGAAFDLCVGR